MAPGNSSSVTRIRRQLQRYSRVHVCVLLVAAIALGSWLAYPAENERYEAVIDGGGREAKKIVHDAEIGNGFAAVPRRRQQLDDISEQHQPANAGHKEKPLPLQLPLPFQEESDQGKTYSATWGSLDARPLPAWYDDYKVGIFIHWGLFSVPSFGSEWFWKDLRKPQSKRHKRVQRFMAQNYKPNASYVDFAPKFNAQFFNASQWVEIFESSGARYVVLTSKHHEGYTLWPSKFASRWNSVDVGPRRDVLGELTKAIRSKSHMKMGYYYSLYEWFHPLYLQDKDNNFRTQNYIDNIMIPELQELVTMYQPDVVWADGAWDAPSSYWKTKEFKAWLYNESPVKDYVVTNDRWGIDASCTHGDFLTCGNRFNPGKLVHKKWENCMTIDRKSWGYVRDAKLNQYMSTQELIEILVSTVSCNGNLLMNIGPTHEGIIDPIYEERLRGMGEWLKVNYVAIYGTRPWRVQQDPANSKVWYTMDTNDEARTILYTIVLEWPQDNTLRLAAPQASDETYVYMQGHFKHLTWKSLKSNRGLEIKMPSANPAQLPCKWAWVLRIFDVH